MLLCGGISVMGLVPTELAVVHWLLIRVAGESIVLPSQIRNIGREAFATMPGI